MTKYFLTMFAILFFGHCFAQSTVMPVTPDSTELKSFPDTTLHSFNFISNTEATLILENSVVLKDSIWKFVGGNWTFKGHYRTIEKNAKTDSPSELYFIFENFKNEKDATRYFDLMKSENGKSSSIKNIGNVGDDNFESRDVLNNPFIMVRNGRGIYKFRTLNITSVQSYTALLKSVEKVFSKGNKGR